MNTILFKKHLAYAAVAVGVALVLAVFVVGWTKYKHLGKTVPNAAIPELTIPDQTEVKGPTLADLAGPFSLDMATIDAEYQIYRYDYFITPDSNQASVLQRLKEYTGRPARFIKGNVRVVSDIDPTKSYVNGYLYQVQFSGDDVYEAATRLKAAMGGNAGAGSITQMQNIGGSVSVQDMHRAYDVDGMPFTLIQKNHGEGVSLAYSAVPLPDTALEILNNVPIETNDAFYLDLQHGVIIVGDTSERSLKVYKLKDGSWHNNYFYPYDFSGQFMMLESPDRQSVAVSYWNEYSSGSSIQSGQSVVVDLTSGVVMRVPTQDKRFFPTAWAGSRVVTYGTAVGKDCGFYPYRGRFDLETQAFTPGNDEDGFWLKDYLFPRGRIYNNSGTQLAVTTVGGNYGSDLGMCDNLMHDKIVTISTIGEQKILYDAPNGYFIYPFGFIDKDIFLFARVPVTQSEVRLGGPDGRSYTEMIREIDKPLLFTVNMKTSEIQASFTLDSLQKKYASMNPDSTAPDFSVDTYSSANLTDVTLDTDYEIDILRHKGKPINRLDKPSLPYDGTIHFSRGYWTFNQIPTYQSSLQAALQFMRNPQGYW